MLIDYKLITLLSDFMIAWLKQIELSSVWSELVQLRAFLFIILYLLDIGEILYLNVIVTLDYEQG